MPEPAVLEGGLHDPVVGVGAEVEEQHPVGREVGRDRDAQQPGLAAEVADPDGRRDRADLARRRTTARGAAAPCVVSRSVTTASPLGRKARPHGAVQPGGDGADDLRRAGVVGGEPDVTGSAGSVDCGGVGLRVGVAVIVSFAGLLPGVVVAARGQQRRRDGRRAAISDLEDCSRRHGRCPGRWCCGLEHVARRPGRCATCAEPAAGGSQGEAVPPGELSRAQPGLRPPASESRAALRGTPRRRRAQHAVVRERWRRSWRCAGTAAGTRPATAVRRRPCRSSRCVVTRCGGVIAGSPWSPESECAPT